MEDPPDDAESWSDEQWISWLDATRDDVEIPTRWRRSFRSRSGGMSAIGAGMLGLQQAIFGPLDEPDVVLVVDADGHDDDDIITIVTPASEGPASGAGPSAELP